MIFQSERPSLVYVPKERIKKKDRRGNHRLRSRLYQLDSIRIDCALLRLDYDQLETHQFGSEYLISERHDGDAFYFSYSFYKIRRNGSISHTLSKVFIIMDVFVQLLVMLGATMDHPDFTTGVVKSPILYGISYLYIVSSGLLLTPNFVLWVGVLSGGAQSLAIYTAARYGLILTENKKLANSLGYASVSEQITKILFILACAFIVRILVKLFMRLRENSKYRQEELEESHKVIAQRSGKMKESARCLKDSSKNLKSFMDDFPF